MGSIFLQSVSIRFKILIEKFRIPLVIVSILLVIGALVIYVFYDPAWDPDYRKAIVDALSATAELMIGVAIFAYPPNSGELAGLVIRIVYLIWPLLGQIFIVYSIFEFGFTIFQWNTRQELLHQAQGKRMKNHTIVVGLGNVGRTIVQELLRANVEHITVIAIGAQYEDDFVQTYSKRGVVFLFGDAMQSHVLSQANVFEASCILLATSNDLVNFKISVLAKTMNKKIRTVLRIFDHEFAETIRALPEVDETVSTSTISAATFVAKAHAEGVVATLSAEHFEEEGPQDLSKPMVLIKIKVKKLDFGNSPEPVVDVLVIEKEFNVTILSVNGRFHVKQADKVEIWSRLLVLGELMECQRLKQALETP